MGEGDVPRWDAASLMCMLVAGQQERLLHIVEADGCSNVVQAFVRSFIVNSYLLARGTFKMFTNGPTVIPN